MRWRECATRADTARMRIERVAPDFFIAIGDTYAANASVLLKGNEALLVDGMASIADAEALRRQLDADGRRVRMIVCTHYFSDHLAALRLFPEAEIVAHELYRQTFDSELHRTDEETAHFVEPTIVIGDRARIRWGRFTLDVFHNPGHTMSTLGIDVAEEDLLFVADTVVGNIVYLAYTSPSLMESALDRLERLRRGRILSSHGGVRSSDAIANAKDYLKRLREGATDFDLSDFEHVFHERNVELRQRSPLAFT